MVEDEAEMMVELDEVLLEAGGWVRVGEWDGGDEDVVVFGVGGVIEDREGGVAREVSLGKELGADFLKNLFLEANSWLWAHQ